MLLMLVVVMGTMRSAIGVPMSAERGASPAKITKLVHVEAM